MSFVVIFGVMWGLIFGEDAPQGSALAAICCGVAVACAGFATMGLAVHQRDTKRHADRLYDAIAKVALEVCVFVCGCVRLSLCVNECECTGAQRK